MISFRLIQVVLCYIHFQVRGIAGGLPTLTENEDPANKPWLYLPPSRVPGDVLIPYGLDFSDGVRYYVDWEGLLKPAEVDKLVRGDVSLRAEQVLKMNMNCKTLFSPGKMFFRNYKYKGATLFDLKIDESKYRYLEMKPVTLASQAALSRIRSCCSSVDPCTERCFDVKEVKNAFFAITASDGKTILMTGRCTYCTLKSCISQCSEGEYVTSYADLDQVKIFFNLDFSICCSGFNPCKKNNTHTFASRNPIYSL